VQATFMLLRETQSPYCSYIQKCGLLPPMPCLQACRLNYTVEGFKRAGCLWAYFGLTQSSKRMRENKQ
jgi:hypothetical protein